MKTNKKHLPRYIAGFILSLLLSLFCIGILSSVEAYATFEGPEEPAVTTYQEGQETMPEETAPPYEIPATDNDDTGLLGLLALNDNNGTLDLVILITILTLAPSILLMFTCFTRIIIVFSLLRTAMGTQTVPPNQVMVGLAFFLTLFVMSPVFSEVNEVAYKPYKNGELTTIEACAAATTPLKEFMLKQTETESLEFFCDISGEEFVTGEEAMNISFKTITPAFILSEIKTAFTIGFLIFIPFLIIDIVVSSLLMSMGMIMLPPATISMPFKILMFVLVDGWQLLIGSLIAGFNV